MKAETQESMDVRKTAWKQKRSKGLIVKRQEKAFDGSTVFKGMVTLSRNELFLMRVCDSDCQWTTSRRYLRE